MAMSVQLGESTFWDMTPKELRWYVAGYNRIKRKKDSAEAESLDATAWLNGIYVSRAIAACFGRNINYPKKPFGGKGKGKTAKQMATEFEALAQMYNRQFDRK